MKKIIYCISLLIVTVLIGCCFVGCGYVEEVDIEGVAQWDKAGNVVYNGKTYKKISGLGVRDINADFTKEVSLENRKDSEDFSSTIMLSSDDMFFHDISGEYFCREDKYLAVQDKLENGFEINSYMYEYSDSGESTRDFDIQYFTTVTYTEIIPKERIFTDEEIAAINDVFENVKPITELMHDFIENVQQTIYVQGCSDDNLVIEECYQIFIDRDNYYIYNLDDSGNLYIYKVPQKYNEIFRKLTKEFINSYPANKY